MEVKRAAAAVMAAVMMLSVCACGVTPDSTGDASVENSVESSAQSSAEVSSETFVGSMTVNEPAEEPSSESSAEPSAEEQSSEEPSVQESRKQESTPEESAPSEVSEPAENSVQESSVQESSTAVQPVQTEQVQTNSEVTGITLSHSSIRIYKGYIFTISASIQPSNAVDKSFRWNWSDDSIISVNSYGTVTAKAVGKATITAETANGKTAVCEVEVTEKPKTETKQTTQKPSQTSQASAQPAPEVSYGEAPDVTGTYVGASWFDDAVFVGDSVSVKLQYYADNGSLGNADFLCAVSLGYNNSLWDLNRRGNVHPLYKGKKVTVDEGVRLCGKKKVFIMLGMNDVGIGVDFAIKGMKELTDRILRKSPDVQIYIQSVTPLLKSIKRKDKLNNTNVAKFNELARQVCYERGFVFVNVAEAVSDGQGNLVYEYCGDPTYMGLHFSNAGCAKWVDYLKRHVA